MMNGLPGAVVALAVFTASAEDVKLEQVPEQVRATIEKYVGDDDKVDDIDRENRHGNIVYEVEYEDSEGDDQKLLVAEDGTLIERWTPSP